MHSFVTQPLAVTEDRKSHDSRVPQLFSIVHKASKSTFAFGNQNVCDNLPVSAGTIDKNSFLFHCLPRSLPMKEKRIFVYGASGHGKVVADILISKGKNSFLFHCLPRSLPRNSGMVTMK